MWRIFYEQRPKLNNNNAYSWLSFRWLISNNANGSNNETHYNNNSSVHFVHNKFYKTLDADDADDDDDDDDDDDVTIKKSGNILNWTDSFWCRDCSPHGRKIDILVDVHHDTSLNLNK